jgi:hypothetical protein
VIWDVKIANRSRWYRAATGFDATRAVQQQDASSAPRQVMSRCGASGAAANDNDIELFVI